MLNSDKTNLGRGGKLEKKIREIHLLIVGLVVVLFIGFASMFTTVGTLVWNAHIFGRDTYQELVRELYKTNTKIEVLIKQNEGINGGYMPILNSTTSQ